MLQQSMLAVLATLLPVFLLILTGLALRLSGIIALSDWRGIEAITYYVFMPAVMITTLYKADLGSVPAIAFGGALLTALMVIVALMLLLRRQLQHHLAITPAAFTSLFQGVTRWNTFVALSIAAAAFGARGLTLVGICIASLTPLLNVLAVGVMARHAHGKPLSGWPFLANLIKNPMIWSTLLGLALNLMHVPVPAVMVRYGDMLQGGGIAVGLLVVGGGLEPRTLLRPRLATLMSVAVKLMLFPLLASIAGRAYGLSAAQDVAVLVICTAVPTAPAAYVLAKLNGGDAPLMAEIITVQTIAAMLTMPVIMVLLA